MATVIFSSAIVGFLAVGTLYQFVSGFDIMMLGGTFGALAYKRTGYEFYLRSIDSILPANIAHMLQSRKNQHQMLFTEEESRSIIDWLEHKFTKQKTYINFFINTSMLIGLLGTFVGLVESIDKMGQIILSLNGDVEMSEIMQQFSGPLSGMAIGFGASLFGVVTAVILGLNGYILFRYQDTLISGVEEWLKDRIIDMAPEHINTTSLSAESDLAGHRKNFMDVYLDQLSLLTAEIVKSSNGAQSIATMASSLSSIETILNEQKEYMRSTLELQQANQTRYEALSRSLNNLYELTDNRLEDHKTSLDAISESAHQLLVQNDTQMNTLNSNIALMNDQIGTKIDQLNEKSAQNASAQLVSLKEAANSLDENKRSLKTLLKLQESSKSQDTAFHSQAIELLEGMDSGIHASKESNNVLIAHVSEMKQGINGSLSTLNDHTSLLKNIENTIGRTASREQKSGGKKGLFSFFSK
ncbi:MotA/TolQ/ExbB proton channel family protein [Sulfuricurvum sp.]|uniref:MotA/TolQ/ExbB proton channel family protein n=1 Tax=Sulfuricurvum sp. TaxID=2025608 RepID=UPI002E304631|nr:MotA/TolQ/ExbB proton channel family protein [Sulfuricurvum sp.]HEX5329070.1 MotA/TolQ/ExbB proton channel family protein [Sulfuricurvum sp.]